MKTGHWESIVVKSRFVSMILILALLAIALSTVSTFAEEWKCYCVSGPDSVSVCPGATASFSVSATGE